MQAWHSLSFLQKGPASCPLLMASRRPSDSRTAISTRSQHVPLGQSSGNNVLPGRGAPGVASGSQCWGPCPLALGSQVRAVLERPSMVACSLKSRQS